MIAFLIFPSLSDGQDSIICGILGVDTYLPTPFYRSIASIPIRVETKGFFAFRRFWKFLFDADGVEDLAALQCNSCRYVAFLCRRKHGRLQSDFLPGITHPPGSQCGFGRQAQCRIPVCWGDWATVKQRAFLQNTKEQRRHPLHGAITDTENLQHTTEFSRKLAFSPLLHIHRPNYHDQFITSSHHHGGEKTGGICRASLLVPCFAATILSECAARAIPLNAEVHAPAALHGPIRAAQC